jgi:multiple sugar transport system substrate-binding protein
MFNFEAFKNPEFQQQLANPVPFPRQMPAVANAFENLDVWELRDQIRDEGVRYNDIASEWDTMMNEYLEDYLRQYNR